MSNWLLISKSQGEGNDIITITAGTYSELIQRVSNVKFTNEEFGLSSMTQVVQEAFVPEPIYVNVSPSSIDNIPQIGGTYQICVESNGDWSVQVPSWATSTVSSGNGNACFYVTIHENESESMNIGDVRIISKDDISVVSLIQEGYVDPVIECGTLKYYASRQLKTSDFAYPDVFFNKLTNHIYNSTKGVGYMTWSDDITTLPGAAFQTRASSLVLTKVVLPDCVTNIGDNAFRNQTKLTSVVLPETLENIGAYSFAYTGLKTITIPSSVTYINTSPFLGTSLTSVVMEGSTPPTLYSFDDSSFAGNYPIYVPCEAVMAYSTAPIWLNYYNSGRILCDEEVTIKVTPSSIEVPYTGGTYELSVESNGEWIVNSSSWIGTSKIVGTGNATVTITIGENEVEEYISGYVKFSTADNVVEVNVVQEAAPTPPPPPPTPPVFSVYPESIKTTYRGESFEVCITSELPWSITLPDWITANKTSGNSDECITLTVAENNNELPRNYNIEVTNGEDIIIIKAKQYSNLECGSLLYYADRKVERSDVYPYQSTWENLVTSNEFNNGVGKITWSGNTSTIPNAILYILNDSDITISEVVIPECITAIEGRAFYNSKIEDVNLPDSIEEIGGYAFYETNISNNNKTLVLPENLRAIGDYAFSGNKFDEVVIPSGVTYLGGSCFYDYYHPDPFPIITFEGVTPPECGTYSLGNSSTHTPIYVPCEAVDTYKALIRSFNGPYTNNYDENRVSCERYIAFSQPSIEFPYYSGNTQVNITSNWFTNEELVIISKPDWYPYFNIGDVINKNTKLYLYYDEYDGDINRTGEIVFQSSVDAERMGILTINQKVVIVSPTSINALAIGGKYYMDVKSSKDWTALAPSWVTLSRVTGDSGNIRVVATINENTGNERTGNITFFTPKEKAIVLITQSGKM